MSPADAGELGIRCEPALAAMRRQLGDIDAVVATADGRELARCGNRGRSDPRLAPMACSMGALSSSLSDAIGLGASRSLIVESEGGHLVLIGFGAAHFPLVLCVSAGKEVLAGRLAWQARACADAIQQALATTPLRRDPPLAAGAGQLS